MLPGGPWHWNPDNISAELNVMRFFCCTRRERCNVPSTKKRVSPLGAMVKAQIPWDHPHRELAEKIQTAQENNSFEQQGLFLYREADEHRFHTDPDERFPLKWPDHLSKQGRKPRFYGQDNEPLIMRDTSLVYQQPAPKAGMRRPGQRPSAHFRFN